MVHVEHRAGVEIISGMRKRMWLEFIFRDKAHVKECCLYAVDINPHDALLTRAW
jgi:hypothetical protein